jgi:hypothetical protein
MFAQTGRRSDIIEATRCLEVAPRRDDCHIPRPGRQARGASDRRGHCRLERLIERYGIDAKLFDWSDEITANCPRKQVSHHARRTLVKNCESNRFAQYEQSRFCWSTR